MNKYFQLYDNGDVGVWRDMLDEENLWGKDFKLWDMLFYLALVVNRKISVYKWIYIKRGQVVTTRRLIADELGTTVDKVRGILKKLENRGFIAVDTKTTKGMIITLLCIDDEK